MARGSGCGRSVRRHAGCAVRAPSRRPAGPGPCRGPASLLCTGPLPSRCTSVEGPSESERRTAGMGMGATELPDLFEEALSTSRPSAWSRASLGPAFGVSPNPPRPLSPLSPLSPRTRTLFASVPARRSPWARLGVGRGRTGRAPAQEDTALALGAYRGGRGCPSGAGRHSTQGGQVGGAACAAWPTNPATCVSATGYRRQAFLA